MVLYRKFLATLAASFLAPWPSPSKVVPLGLVTHAERAYLGQVESSVGSTIYDGDLLSTEIGGRLRISNIALTLQLGPASSLTPPPAAAPARNLPAELGT